MPAAVEVLDLVAGSAVHPGALEIVWADRRFAVAAGNIEHIGRLAQPREPSAQRPHQRLPLLDAGAPVRRARREITMVEVIGFDPALDQGAHQFAERRRVVVDAAQEHALAQHRDAGIDQPRAGRPRFLGQLARVVDVQRHVSRLAGRPKRTSQLGAIRNDTGWVP